MLAFISWLIGRLQTRAELEIEVIALRHQLTVLRRQRPSRPWLGSLDRLLWVWLYRLWPHCLGVLVLGQAGHRGSVAPSGVSPILALALTPRTTSG
jgi:hypothetical protein